MANKISTQLIIDGKNKAGAAFNEAEGQLNKLGLSAKAAGAYIAGALSITALAAFVKTSIDAADAASKSASAVGLAVEEYTALQYAAELAGVGAGELDAGLSKLNRTIDAAANGGQAQAEAFDRLGISVVDAGGKVKSSEQVLAEIADKFATMPNGVQKSAIAMELFGRSGAKLIPLLNGGSAGLEELRKEAEAYGLVISSDTAASAEAFNDNLSRLGKVTTGAGNQIAAGLLPSLESLSELLVNVNKEGTASSTIATLLGGAMKVLATVVLVTANAFGSLGRFIGASAAAAVAVAKGEFSQAAEIMRDVGAENAREQGLMISRVKELWSGAGEAAAAAAIELKGRQLLMVGDLKRTTDAMSEQLKQQVKDAKSALAERVKVERDAAKQLEDAKKAQLDTEKRYSELRARLNGAGGGEPDYGQAQALKVAARNALQAGDLEKAKSQAQAAAKILDDLAAAGGDTYGLQGFADELQRIEQSADQINVDRAKQSFNKAEADAERLKTVLDEASKVEVSIDLPPEQIERIKGIMQGLAAEISQTMVITPKVALPQPGEADSEGYVFVPNLPTPPGFAKGTNSAPPGMAWVGEEGPELVNFAGGEQVLTATASQNLMARLAGLNIPDLSAGLVETAASATPSMPNLGRLAMDFGRGDELEVFTTKDGALNLQRLATKLGRKRR